MNLLIIFFINRKISHDSVYSASKISVSKFQYFGKYIIQLYGYFYVNLSRQRQTGLER